MTSPALSMLSRAEAAAAVLVGEGAREVYLFGSVARGQEGADSDLDMAVSGLAPERFYFAMARAADAAGVSIDLVDLDEATPFVRVLREQGGLVRVADHLPQPEDRATQRRELRR